MNESVALVLGSKTNDVVSLKRTEFDPSGRKRIRRWKIKK
jgi:hypothetical protein